MKNKGERDRDMQKRQKDLILMLDKREKLNRIIKKKMI